MYKYFVEPIYTFPEDLDFPMEKYGLRVDVKASNSVITMLRDFHLPDSEQVHLALDLDYSHEWKQDVIKGPGMCNIGVDLSVNSLHIGRISESPFINGTLITPLRLQLNQGYVVQAKKNEIRKEMTGTNLMLSRKQKNIDTDNHQEIAENNHTMEMYIGVIIYWTREL